MVFGEGIRKEDHDIMTPTQMQIRGLNDDVAVSRPLNRGHITV